MSTQDTYSARKNFWQNLALTVTLAIVMTTLITLYVAFDQVNPVTIFASVVMCIGLVVSIRSTIWAYRYMHRFDT